MSMISGGYVSGPAVQRAQVLVVQGDSVRCEPAPESRFVLAMEHPFPQPQRDSVPVVLHLGEVIVSLDAAAAQIRKLTRAVLTATGAGEAAEDAYGNKYPDASDFLAGLPHASGTFTGTFDLTDEEMAGFLVTQAMLPAVVQDDTAIQAIEQAAKNVLDDARLGLRIAPGNTLHIAPGPVSLSVS